MMLMMVVMKTVYRLRLTSAEVCQLVLTRSFECRPI